MNGIDYVVADAGPIYPGVKFTRTLCLLNDKLVVVCDQVRSADEHIYDLVYHQRGTWNGLVPGAAWNPSDKKGYRYLSGATVRPAEAGFTASLSLGPEMQTTITLMGNAPTDIITAKVIVHDPVDWLNVGSACATPLASTVPLKTVPAPSSIRTCPSCWLTAYCDMSVSNVLRTASVIC